jgi:hypothetical protein
MWLAATKIWRHSTTNKDQKRPTVTYTVAFLKQGLLSDGPVADCHGRQKSQKLGLARLRMHPLPSSTTAASISVFLAA